MVKKLIWIEDEDWKYLSITKTREGYKTISELVHKIILNDKADSRHG